MKLYLNPNIYTQDFVKKLQVNVQSWMLAGAIPNEFISEGTQIKGLAAFTIQEVVDAIDYYWDEVSGTLVTDTQPNFGSYPTIIQGQQY